MYVYGDTVRKGAADVHPDDELLIPIRGCTIGRHGRTAHVMQPAAPRARFKGNTVAADSGARATGSPGLIGASAVALPRSPKTPAGTEGRLGVLLQSAWILLGSQAKT